ncbi:MAG: succinate dehydrogenase assembly factor 2 [Alphaproteobacteria bacterium]|nr:succinate dehydrogenase assembly factor 2 [Alphaproteobacteria bacterium]
MSKDHLIYVKKLLYLSRYRGCKESEIIFSNFAELHLTELNEASLCDYEKILEYPDSILMDWFLFNKTAPQEIVNNLVYQKISDSISAKK